MTKPRTRQRDLQAPLAADPAAPINPDMILDLEVSGDDADDVGGGKGAKGAMTYLPITMTDVIVTAVPTTK